MSTTTDIFGALFGRIDSLGTGMVQTMYTAFATALAPVFWSGATVFVVWWGYEMLIGKVGLTGGTFLWRVGRLAIIYTMATSWATFSPLVADVLIKAPNDVATVICQGTGSSDCGSDTSSMSQALSDMLATATNASKNITQAGGWTGVGLMILGAAVLIIVGFLLCVAAGLLILGKVALFLMLASAPIFICLALFQFTSGMFTGWMAALFQYGLVIPVVVYGILGVMMIVLKDTMGVLAAQISSNETIDLTLVIPFVLMCATATYLLFQAPTISAGIAGGARLEAGRMLGHMGLAGKAAVALGALGASTGYQGARAGVAAAGRAWAGRNATLEAALKAARS